MSATQQLSELTTIAVGGAPEIIKVAKTTAELYEACRQVWASGKEWLILGGGSNMLVADDVAELQVVKVENLGIERTDIDQTRVLLKVQAGENWDALVAHCVSQGLAGIEALSGIPGSTGAVPVQNVGAYGQEVSQTITRVEFLDYETGQVAVLPASELEFAYRHSALKGSSDKPARLGVIGWVEFELQKLGGLSVPLASGQITNHVGAPYGSQLPLQQVRDVVIELRSGKGMVLKPGDADTVSVGSFFTNPVISYAQSLGFPSEMQRWPMHDAEGSVKLSAGWLIENAGIGRGFAIAGSRAAVSSKHALALTNRGGATAEEILELARLIQDRVAARWGINLVPEPNLIGFN